MQHKALRQNWPCVPLDPNRQPVQEMWRNEPAILQLGDEAMGCVPCLFKNSIGGYRGDVLIDRKTGEPAPLPIAHESFHPLQQLSRRWHYTETEGIENQV
jgi:hypothetical protein